MIGLGLNSPAEAPLRLLLLGAHSDDIEIGCGATILRLIREHPRVAVRWVVFSGGERRAEEARTSAAAFLEGAERAEVMLHHFRDGFYPYIGGEIKEVCEAIKGEFTPDLIFTHHAEDRHQDHRVVSELTWNTFRNHLVLEYEIPKYDGGLTTPNFYVAAGEGDRRAKLRLLMEAFATQRDKHWFNEATFEGLMRLRGVECASPTGYAEGFHARKLLFHG